MTALIRSAGVTVSIHAWSRSKCFSWLATARKASAWVPSMVTSATAVSSPVTNSRRTRTSRSGKALDSSRRYHTPSAATGPCRLSGTRDTAASGVIRPRIPSTSPACMRAKNSSARLRALNGSRPQPLQLGASGGFGRSRVLPGYQVPVGDPVGPPGRVAVVEDRAAVLQRCLQVPGHANPPRLGLVLFLVGERGHPVAIEHPRAVELRCGQQCRGSVAQRGDCLARAVHQPQDTTDGGALRQVDHRPVATRNEYPLEVQDLPVGEAG